ncbi:MAG: FAD-dependent oxidoreductase, partial [Vicinamibacteria bacterium]
MDERFDLAVLGTGPGGYIAAIRAAQLGLRVVAIERDRPGGVCLNWGCIPSKAILSSAGLYDDIKNSRKHGIVCENVTFDYGEVIKRSRQAADRLCKGVEFLFRKNKIRLVAGTGRLTSGKSLEVSAKEDGSRPMKIEADRILLATGSTERVFPGLDVDGERIMTSREAIVAKGIPASIAVIGG